MAVLIIITRWTLCNLGMHNICSSFEAEQVVTISCQNTSVRDSGCMTQRAAVTFPHSNNSKDEADTGMTPVATGKKHLPWWLNLVAGARSTHHDYFQLIMTVSC